MKKSSFNLQERKILKVLGSTRRALAVNEIAKKSNLSWVTVKKHLEKLAKRRWVEWE